MPIARINGHDMYYEIHGRGDLRSAWAAGAPSATAASAISPAA